MHDVGKKVIKWVIKIDELQCKNPVRIMFYLNLSLAECKDVYERVIWLDLVLEFMIFKEIRFILVMII